MHRLDTPANTLCSEALLLAGNALVLLDGTDAPSEIGAYLDLAIHRLHEHLTQIERAR